MEDWERFIGLFGGLEHAAAVGAFGTGSGGWVHRPLRESDVREHLDGSGSGIGVGPLGPGDTVRFAAIDLDEPDFDAALDMQSLLPEPTFIERSRSGNAHVWAFFKAPIPAWVPMGIMREMCKAAGKPGVEVFPKNPRWDRVKYGNYINLPYHGDSRPVVTIRGLDPVAKRYHMDDWPLSRFLFEARDGLQDPAAWVKRANWLQLVNPMLPRPEPSAPFGESPNLHMCAGHLLDNCQENPVVRGCRATVFFCLAKMLSQWALCDHDEALMYMRHVNKCSPDPVPDRELERILGNAERGRFTSTGCDDPAFQPYAHPECPISRRGDA